MIWQNRRQPAQHVPTTQVPKSIQSPSWCGHVGCNFVGRRAGWNVQLVTVFLIFLHLRSLFSRDLDCCAQSLRFCWLVATCNVRTQDLEFRVSGFSLSLSALPPLFRVFLKNEYYLNLFLWYPKLVQFFLIYRNFILIYNRKHPKKINIFTKIFLVELYLRDEICGGKKAL